MRELRDVLDKCAEEEDFVAAFLHQSPDCPDDINALWNLAWSQGALCSGAGFTPLLARVAQALKAIYGLCPCRMGYPSDRIGNGQFACTLARVIKASSTFDTDAIERRSGNRRYVVNAFELLSEYTRRVSEGEVDRALDLFAEDAVIEFPYFPSAGLGGRVAGIETIRKNVGDFFKNRTKDCRFHDVKIFASDSPDRAFGKYSGTARIKATGRIYTQLYGGRLEALDGRICLLREFCNSLEVAIAIFPNGLSDMIEKMQR